MDFFLHPKQSTKTPGLRPMERRDIRQVTELLQKYLRRFQLAPSMGEEEVAHWFLPQDTIIDTYVVEVSGISFYPQILMAYLLILLLKQLLCPSLSSGCCRCTDRLRKFLHSALDCDAPPSPQEPEGCLLFLQRSYTNPTTGLNE